MPTFNGTSGDDTIIGSIGDDEINLFGGNDSARGGNGEDEIFGGDGIDVIDGEANDDTLYGGSGNDTITGGASYDLMYGGSGDDVFTGAGDDTIIQSRGADDTLIIDFDIGDTNSDGFYNDQLDVSALRTLGGAPVTNTDVTVTNDGSGNAVLTFPEGETIRLFGVTPAQMSTPAQLRAAGVPCFTTGTPILTTRGAMPIERLRIGDKVQTRDNGLQTLRWIGARSLTHQDLAQTPWLRPILIAAGAFGNTRDLLVSPQHGMSLRSDGGETFVRAKHLAELQGGKVRVAHGVKRVTYVHLLFDAHQVIYGGGLASESYYPGQMALAGLDVAARMELDALFPDLKSHGVTKTYGPAARDYMRKHALPDHINAFQ